MPNTNTSDLRVEWLATDQLTPDPRNPRQHPDRQINLLAKSIDDLGFNTPILTDGNGKILAGHGRWLAARKLGRQAVPIVRLQHLTDTQAKAFMLADNRINSRAVAGLMAKEWGDRLIRVRLGTKAHDRPKSPAGRAQPFTTIPYEVSAAGYSFPESSARSRGFKFAMLSGIAAYLSKAQTIFVPESGQGALGPALVPVGQAYSDYRNHPLFTGRMTVLLEALFGQKVHFKFPRLWFTKAETLTEYLKANKHAEWSTTRSCWQDNRHVSVDGKRRQCGICAACMLRRLSIHAAGLEEAKETYVWENLKAPTFEEGAAQGLKKIEKVQHEYAIAGTLHLDHLANLKGPAIHAPGIRLNAKQVAKALDVPDQYTQIKLDRLSGAKPTPVGPCCASNTTMAASLGVIPTGQPCSGFWRTSGLARSTSSSSRRSTA